MNKAVALKYSRDLPAPFVLAKGRDDLARRLVGIARDHGIEIAEHPDAAEQLFECEVGSWIPEALFEVIAQILAYVYKVQAGE